FPTWEMEGFTAEGARQFGNGAVIDSATFNKEKYGARQFGDGGFAVLLPSTKKKMELDNFRSRAQFQKLDNLEMESSMLG
ncbi:hypothetical protein Dimus_013035, partial [Dionaea muscipula]